jgi:DNA-directed RNA polymerase subunit RPC12/RpoP
MPNRPEQHVSCPRCDIALDYVGTRKFHEGTRAFDFLGGVFELFKNREHFDVYVCSRCGRVELFVDGIGEEMRPG